MKPKVFQYLLKFYLTLFSMLFLFSIFLSIGYIVNNEFDQMLSVMKNCFTFAIFFLFGIYHEKIEHWLELYWDKKKT